MGLEIWDSLPEDVKDLTFLQKFTEFLRNSLKHGTDLNANSTSENSWVTHITIVELYTLAWICPCGNLTPNLNKQNIRRNKAVILWCVYSWFLVCTHPIWLISFFCFFFRFGLGFDPVFIVQNLIFFLALLVNI